MFGRLAIVFMITVCISSCDSHKEERISVEQKLSEIVRSIGGLDASIREVVRDIDAANSEKAAIADKIKQKNAEINSNKKDLASYVMDRKMAASASVGTVAGTAAILSNELSDDQRAAAGLVTFFGAMYCLANYDECQSVSTRILWYGSQIEMARSDIKKLSDKESVLIGRIVSLGSKRNTLESQVSSLRSQRTSLEMRRESLACKFPICI